MTSLIFLNRLTVFAFGLYYLMHLCSVLIFIWLDFHLFIFKVLSVSDFFSFFSFWCPTGIYNLLILLIPKLFLSSRLSGCSQDCNIQMIYHTLRLMRTVISFCCVPFSEGDVSRLPFTLDTDSRPKKGSQSGVGS